jgi:hypothetical protein
MSDSTGTPQNGDHAAVLAGVLASLTERFAAEREAGTLTALTDQQIAEWQVEALSLAGYVVAKPFTHPRHGEGLMGSDDEFYLPVRFSVEGVWVRRNGDFEHFNGTSHLAGRPRHPVTGRFLAHDCEVDCLDHCAGLCGAQSEPTPTAARQEVADGD